jgi:hypothetical protein
MTGIFHHRRVRIGTTQPDDEYYEEILLQGIEHGFKVEVGTAEPIEKTLLNETRRVGKRRAV